MPRKIKFELEVTLRDEPSCRKSHNQEWAKSFLSLKEDVDIVYNFLELTKMYDSICDVLDEMNILSVNDEPIEDILKRIVRDNNNE